MTLNLTRRLMLTGAMGSSIAGAAACVSSVGTATTAAAEAEGAFPVKAGIDPYLLGPKDGVALLSRNENPYGPSKSARDMIEYAATKGAYYTSREAQVMLTEMIAEKNGVAPEQVVVTTGSGEVLSAIALIYGPKGPIVAPRLFWDTTALYAVNLGMAKIERVPLAADMSIDLPAIEAKVTDSTGLVQLCNPNNPTGLVSDASTLQAAVKRMAAKTTVLVDEAYIELSDDPDANSCVPLINAGHDVIVTRTFSKIYGMAGVRVGYSISSAETAEKIRATAMSWSPSLSIAAAIGCYNDEAFLTKSRSKIQEARDMVNMTVDSLDRTGLRCRLNLAFFKSVRERMLSRRPLATARIRCGVRIWTIKK